MKGKMQKEVVVILDDIRSVFNVGSIFRTADALGVSEIILSKITPAPFDRFGRARKDLAKVALGAEKKIAWRTVPNVFNELLSLKEKGFKIIAIEQAETSIDYKKIKINKTDKVAFVIGAEVEGVAQKNLKLADFIAEIPMLGSKESLNVSVAFGVALFRILNV